MEKRTLGKNCLEVSATPGTTKLERLEENLDALNVKLTADDLGAQLCEVRVHEETGEVRVSRWLSVVDCGSVVNPKTAISQIRGGIISVFSAVNRLYAECRIMPSPAGERQWGGHRILGVLGIIRAPKGTPEVRRLA